MPPDPPISGKVGDLGLENKPEFEHLDLEGCSNVKGRVRETEVINIQMQSFQCVNKESELFPEAAHVPLARPPGSAVV